MGFKSEKYREINRKKNRFLIGEKITIRSEEKDTDGQLNNDVRYVHIIEVFSEVPDEKYHRKHTESD